MAGKLADPAGTASRDMDDYPSWIHAYSYLRGLDGQLPATSDGGYARQEGRRRRQASREPRRQRCQAHRAA